MLSVNIKLIRIQFSRQKQKTLVVIGDIAFWSFIYHFKALLRKLHISNNINEVSCKKNRIHYEDLHQHYYVTDESFSQQIHVCLSFAVE